MFEPQLKPNKPDILINDDIYSTVNELLNLDILGKINYSANDNKTLELIFNLYEIIDLIKENKINNLDGLKKFLFDFQSLLEYMTNMDKDYFVKNELDDFFIEKEKIIDECIKNGNSNDKIIKELTNILYQTEIIYKKKLENTLKNNNGLKNNDVYKVIDEFNIPEIDKLYEKLYESIEKNDVKKIILYRGRLIKKLKLKRNLIDSKYEEVKVLEEINNLLNLNNPEVMSQIKEILSREENIKFNYYLDGYVYDFYKFKGKFEELYIENQVKKKVLYKNALNVELNEHSRVLSERYEREFLDKKGNLASLMTVLPNGVGLSIKKVVNTINELKEAKANRKKITKLFQVFKDSGKMVFTPIIYLGKFVASNWYSLYMLYNGYSNYRNSIPETESKINNMTADNIEKNGDVKKQIKPNVKISSDENTIVDFDKDIQLHPELEVNSDIFPDFNTTPHVKPEVSPQTKPEIQPEVEAEPQINSNNGSSWLVAPWWWMPYPLPVSPTYVYGYPNYMQNEFAKYVERNEELYSFFEGNMIEQTKDWTNENIIEPAGEWVYENMIEPVGDFFDYISTISRSR